uniref:Signal peptide peptidase SppA n=1 Tax=Desulfobacca acetoxidans TaxID=60893 RepID=A0A7C5EW97_9BACT
MAASDSSRMSACTPKKIFILLTAPSVLAVFFIFGCITVKVNLFEEEAKPLKERVISGYGPDKILLLDLTGLLVDSPRRGIWHFFGPTVSPSQVKEALDKARKDERVKAVVLRINSPGGTVSAADMIYHEIVRFKKEKGLPVIACFMGLAASGGYYVAQAADEIVAHPTTITGSIGVVAMRFNIKGLMDKVGVEQDSVKSGPWKDFWSPFKPATEAEKQMMQAIIADFYQRFLAVVKQGRKLTREEVSQVADGRVFTASQARDLKLVDRLGYLEEALASAQERAGLPAARVVMYHRPQSYRPTIYSLMAEGLGELAGPQFLYLWAAALES